MGKSHGAQEPAGSAAQRAGPAGADGEQRRRYQLKFVEEIVAQAIQARQRRQAAALKRTRAALVDGALDVEVVDQVLFSGLTQEIGRAWGRGWRPAELVRVAVRELTVGHGRMLADAVAAQLRRYPEATVDEHWRAELLVLGAEIWWEHDERFVAGWAQRLGFDRGAAIGVLLDLVHLVRTLPPIERTGPVPGSTQPTRVAAGSAAGVPSRMLNRVRGLLAKAESTDFPDEAEAFTAKAQELMARHSIDLALLAAGARDRPATRRIAVDDPHADPKTLLLQVVAEANRCRAVWLERFGLSTVVGFPADLDATELLFTSLLVQATRAMRQSNPRQDRYGHSTGHSFRQSFLTAYAQRIGERLSTATESTVKEMGGAALLPVLAARSAAVQQAFEAQFPELTSHPAPVSNRDGWRSGRAAADRATLSSPPAVR